MPQFGFRKIGAWGAMAAAYTRAVQRVAIASQMAMAKEAALWVRTMKLTVARGGGAGGPFRPNAAITRFLKGSSRPLVDKGTLLNAIGMQPIPGGGWFVGVNRKERHRSGRSMVDVAYVNEFGAGEDDPTISTDSGEEGPVRAIIQEVTIKQRRFFMFLKMAGLIHGIPKVGDLIMITIPARSFVRSTFAALHKGTDKRVSKNFFAMMGWAR